jgi:hypothetical protein
MRYKELSVNTVASISCRNRLTKVLAGAARWEKGSKGGGNRLRLSNVDTDISISTCTSIPKVSW